MQIRIGHILSNLVDKKFPNLLIASHTGFALNDDTVQSPDVLVIRRDAYHSFETKRGALVGAPDLAIEIVSPSESASDLDEKVEAYLSGGTQTVWVIWPKTKHVLVYDADGSVQRAGIGGTIRASSVFEGTEIAVASLFPAL
jgi:Uma2 family endonuclease